MGSGSLAAMAVFETYWKPNMTRQEAIDVVSEAIEAGIWNDLGSGSNVDVCVIEGEQVEGKYTGKAKTDYLRNYRTPNEKVTKERNYKWRRGVTAWTKEGALAASNLALFRPSVLTVIPSHRGQEAHRRGRGRSLVRRSRDRSRRQRRRRERDGG